MEQMLIQPRSFPQNILFLFVQKVKARTEKPYLSRSLTASLFRLTHLDDQVPLGVTGHSAELSSQLFELRPAVRVNHPAWGEREMEQETKRLDR